RKALHDIYSKLLRLKAYPNYIKTFTTGTINYNLAPGLKWQSTAGDSLKVMVIGNFDTTSKTASVTFPSTGTWNSYLTDSTTTIATTIINVTLQPGEYYVFTNKNVKTIVLPVTWLSFTAQKINNHTAELKWSTTNEVNNDHFEIQRSSNAVSFSKIGTLIANNKRQYQFTDINVYGSVAYYRIKQVDKDGRHSYSQVVKVLFDNNISWQINPNPAHNLISVYFKKELTKLQLMLIDASGKTVYRRMYSIVN